MFTRVNKSSIRTFRSRTIICWIVSYISMPPSVPLPHHPPFVHLLKPVWSFRRDAWCAGHLINADESSCPNVDDELLLCPSGLWSTGLHLAGREPHAQPQEHLGGEISPTLIPPSIFMTRFCMFRKVLCYGWLSEASAFFLPFLFFSVFHRNFFFSSFSFPMSMTPATNEPLEGAGLFL